MSATRRLAGGGAGWCRAVNDLTELLAATRQIVAQTRQRLAGQTPTARPGGSACTTRDARPIAKGRLGKPVEFGYKAQVVDNDDGIVLDHNVEHGQPARRARSWRPAVERVTQAHRAHAAHRHRRPRLRRANASRTPCTTSVCARS